MTDEWTFRTDSGIATVADGRLEISGSAGRLVREKWRDGWTRNETGRRLLFVVSLFGTASFLGRILRAFRDVLTGRPDAFSLVVFGVTCLALLVVVYRSTRTKTARLRDVRVVERVGDDRLRVRFEDEARDSFEVETPTERDADDAAEILRLRGVRVTDKTDAETPESAGFRERLFAKEN
ncbi:hypothetical protein M0R88_13440 [Halorussus gelatinilyticus]|uniref:Uncharacterized protein n=1 Tax=Halorussus gelatinilyticus TaxID=2937524 RepID=A0A8U0IF42_9EURY|nr:hypothetical protein [Halorussus gelatinilyticus]UPV99517.1 hypothetical protein M0R88_13440 [Halorussus gelatinilyticus]